MELEMDGIREHDGVSFTSGQPTSLSECLIGIRRIEYIPTQITKQNPEAFYKLFNGWGIAWTAIWNVIRKRQAPTLTQVRQEVYFMGADLCKWQNFQQKGGGQLEYALDALVNVTKNLCIGGDDGWEYDLFINEIEAKPATVLDRMFDVAKLKCLEIGDNFISQEMGPYYHVVDEGIYGEEDFDY